jgi:hypothetical protein|eukprot:COSAG06_NODE_11551_length_1493_cov_6.554519_2_plen_146_part_00
MPPWSKFKWEPTMVNATHHLPVFDESAHNTASSCAVGAKNGVPGALNGSNGQACFWFSNGCTIGCPVCDGTFNHPGHGSQHFLYKGMNATELKKANISINTFTPAPGDMTLDPKSMEKLNISSACFGKPVRVRLSLSATEDRSNS